MSTHHKPRKKHSKQKNRLRENVLSISNSKVQKFNLMSALRILGRQKRKWKSSLFTIGLAVMAQFTFW